MSTTVQVGTGSGGIGTTTITVTISETGAFVSGTAGKIPNPMQNANSPQDAQTINLSSGANTIMVPALAGGVVIQLPSSNTQTVTLKGVSGDTGIALSTKGITALTFATSPPASFIITTNGTITGVIFYWF